MRLRVSPVLFGVWLGIGRPGYAQQAYLSCLVVQALAVLVWWPKGDLAQALTNEHGPQPLLALVIALGLTLAYYALRCGAEEVLLDGQQSMTEWVAGTPLGAGRLVAGSLLGHWLHTGYLLALSSPLIAMTYTVGGGAPAPLAVALVTLVAQSTFFWLLGGVVYLLAGRHGQFVFVGLRVLLALIYGVTVITTPSLSHLMVTADLLGAGLEGFVTVSGWAPHVEFIAAHLAASALLGAAFWALITRLCRRTRPAGTAQKPR